MEKLLTGIGPVKYNGFMRFVGPVLHFVLHISEDGIIFYRSVSVKIWRFYIELESSMYQICWAPLSWLCQQAPSSSPFGVGSK